MFSLSCITVVTKSDGMSRMQGLVACVDLQSGSNPIRATFLMVIPRLI